MTCPTCGAEMLGETTVCPQCGDRVAVRAQQERLNEARKKPGMILNKAFGNPLFLIYAVMVSIITLSFGLAVLQWLRAPVMITLDIPFLVCAIISTVGVWKAFASSKNRVMAPDVRKIRVLVKCYKIFAAITMVIGIILAIPLLIVGILGKTLTQFARDRIVDLEETVDLSELSTQLDALDQYIDQFGGYFTIFVVSAVIVLVAFLIFQNIVYGKTAHHWQILAKAVSKGEYVSPAKIPGPGLYVLGVLLFLSGIPSILGGQYGYSGALIAMGIALFVTGLFFRLIHKAEIATIKEIGEEKAELNRLTLIAEEEERKYKAARQQLEDELLEKAQKENKERQAQTDAQMQQMMQMMMANMLANQAAAQHETTSDGQASDAQETSHEDAAVEDAPADGSVTDATGAEEELSQPNSEENPVEENSAEDNSSEDSVSEDSSSEDSSSEDSSSEDSSSEENSAEEDPAKKDSAEES